LWATFNIANTKLLQDPFLKKDNKNPTSKVIDAYAKKFGIKNFFKFIDSSEFDVVFQGSKYDMEEMQEKIYQHLSEKIKSYPYNINLEHFLFNNSTINKSTKTLWETFLEELLMNRHKIAHGIEVGSLSTHTELTEYISKVEILTYVFALIVCAYSNPQQA